MATVNENKYEQTEIIYEDWHHADNWNEALQHLLPHKPYCTNNLKKGLLVRPRKSALKHKYIQLNPPGLSVFFTIDIDYKVEYAGFPEDDNLAMPLFCVRNRRNNHVHLIYGLLYPVCTTSAAHEAPLRFLKAIIDAYTERLKGDPMYSGLISKNPWAEKKWRVHKLSTCLYSLNWLAECRGADLSKKPIKRAPEEEIGLGRNCHIFGNVRTWSYNAIRDFWGHKFSEWFDAVKFKCGQENSRFPEPLLDTEINQISKSISRWTWKRITPQGFSASQRNTVHKRWSKESRQEEGIKLLTMGMSVNEVAEELNVTRRTVYNWLTEASPEDVKKIAEFKPENLSEAKPWEDMGVSRRWFYRLKKRGEI